MRWLLAIALVLAADLRAGEQRFAVLGDFRLDSGATIRGCRLGYRTDGALDADRSNVVVVLTWFSGTSAALAGSVGPGKLFDTDRWFVVTIDALGNGVSSSPSNSSTQPGPSFPRFTIADIVRSQHQLLTRELNLESVHAVAGLSMGGMQALQWAVSYPGFMRKVVSITGTPRQTSHDLIFWKTQLDLLESFSGSAGDLKKAMRGVSGMQMLGMWTPAWIVKNIPPGEVDARLEKHHASLTTRDPFDYMSQLRAMIGHDIGPSEAAAGTIRAEMLLVVALQDEAVHPAPARELARLTGAQLVTLSGDCGHLAPGCEATLVAREVARFLDP
ncbi:MAG TPA: alpha/beta fold hydrolase [Thermoanaerobaculia bacterium]|nr:alpha/beta fold hydrolase [Thermoanaerobaculia bacterium]